MCGDSTSRKDVEKLTGKNLDSFGEEAQSRKKKSGSCFIDLCFTDPPYGLGDDSKTRKNKYNQYSDTIENLKKLIDGFFPMAHKICRNVVLTPGNKNQYLYPTPKWTMCWYIPGGVGRGPWGFCCWQPLLCYGADPKLATRQGSWPDGLSDSAPADIIDHPCSKPVKSWSWFMNRCSEVNDSIYDPFCGSGTTIIAAEKLDRKVFAMELSPAYCDVTIKRYENFTGTKAVLCQD